MKNTPPFTINNKILSLVQDISHELGVLSGAKLSLPSVHLRKNNQIKTLILFPPSGKRIWEAICSAVSDDKRPEKFEVTTMEQAVRIALAETSPRKICLLSPASASFGIFKDYKDRGEQFKAEVSRL